MASQAESNASLVSVFARFGNLRCGLSVCQNSVLREIFTAQPDGSNGRFFGSGCRAFFAPVRSCRTVFGSKPVCRPTPRCWLPCRRYSLTCTTHRCLAGSPSDTSLRHDYIRQQQPNWALVLFGDSESINAIVGDQYRVTSSLQPISQQIPKVWLVFHYQDRL